MESIVIKVFIGHTVWQIIKSNNNWDNTLFIKTDKHDIKVIMSLSDNVMSDFNISFYDSDCSPISKVITIPGIKKDIIVYTSGLHTFEDTLLSILNTKHKDIKIVSILNSHSYLGEMRKSKS